MIFGGKHPNPLTTSPRNSTLECYRLIMEITWIEVDLPWVADHHEQLPTPPHPQPDVARERLELGGLSCAEMLEAAEARIERGTPGWRTRDSEYNSVWNRMHNIQRRIRETDPAWDAWRAECVKVDSANCRKSFKNWLEVGMVFETAGGDRFLVGHTTTDGMDGGYDDHAFDLLDDNTRIVRYCMINLPFNRAHECGIS